MAKISKQEKPITPNTT